MNDNVLKNINQLDEDTRAKLFIKERNEVLLALDVDRFQAFWDRWGNPVPDGGWTIGKEPHEDPRLIMMHKARLHVGYDSIGLREKETSRAWLKKHGYDEYMGGVRPEQMKFR